MITIYAIHAPDPDKLCDVTARMRVMGAPTIEVVDCGDHYQALEGSHRLAAAVALGIAPTLVIRGQDDIIDITSFDWFDSANWAQQQYPAGDVAAELFSPRDAVDYRFA
jgi:hypothetical protein